MGESQGTGSRGELRVCPGPQALAPGCGSGFHIPQSLLPAADAATQSLNSDLLTDFAIWHVPLSSIPAWLFCAKRGRAPAQLVTLGAAAVHRTVLLDFVRACASQ